MAHPYTGGSLDAYQASHGQTPGRTRPPQFTGYFSIEDGHALNERELEASNLVLGGSGFVFQPVYDQIQEFDPETGRPVTRTVITGYETAPKWLNELVLGIDGDGSSRGPTGPTQAELAIERSKVQAQNLSTFISGTIEKLQAEIDADRLSTEQAIGEFNRQLDAFSEAGTQFVGIQPFTIAPGSEFFPGRGPGDIGEKLGRPILEASPIDFDPFGMAADIVANTPVISDIGVPNTSQLDEAIAIAKGFI